MFINKTSGNRNNLCGEKMTKLRVAKGWSQRQVADKLQLLGLEIDKNAIQRIEAGKRFVTDIELVFFAQVFNTTLDALLLSDEGNM